MHAPIRHRAAGVVPEVAEGRPPVFADTPPVGIEWTLGRWPEPQVPVEPFGWIAVRRTAKALDRRQSRLKRAAEVDLAELARFDDVARFLEELPGSLHRARLHYALIFARGLHHLYALFH